MGRFVMGMSNDLQNECHFDMLHDDMNISHFMVHTKHVEEARTRKESRDAKRKHLLMEVLQRIVLRYKTSLRLRSRFQVKFFPSSERLVVIGCLILCSRREKVLIHESRSQIV